MKSLTFMNFLLINFLSAQSLVYWEPGNPNPGETVTIFYNHIEGSLPNNTIQVYVHLGFNGWQETEDFPMSFAPELGNGWWRYEYDIPLEADILDFVFTDLDGNWDNNGGMGIDWHINLNYSWTPFNPGPNDEITILIQNSVQGGEIGWNVNTGNGQEMPIESYWNEGSYAENEMVFSPLASMDENIFSTILGPFSSGEQVVNSVKFGIRWEDGSWDSNSIGQVLFYDIYLDYTIGEDDPYVFFVSPTPDDGDVVQPPITFQVIGSALNVEFWLNGQLIGNDNSSPFELTWTPESNQFGQSVFIVIATNGNGGASYLFRELYLLPNVISEPVPEGVKDGVIVTGQTVSIALFAPFKNFVAVKGSWNQQFPEGELMNLSGDSLWWYQTELEDGDYEYQYNVDGEKLMADPWSKDVTWVDPSGQWESGNYQHAKTVFSVGEPEFEWTDQAFVRPEQKDVIIYEMHIGDFKGDPINTGTFQEVTQKINEGYFNNLGINTIELMPINEFEGDWSWGYNPSFYMAPESSYGTPNELKELVNSAHEHGIAVIFDVVFNHLWGSSPMFQLYHPENNWNYEDHNYSQCPYFQNEESPWGYKLQHWHDVDGRSYRSWKHISDVLFTYVDDYHADGFRFDVTTGIGWGGDENGSSFYADILDDRDPTLILIAEEDNPYQINNSDFDAGWDYSYHHSFFNNLMGYASNMWDLQNHLQWWSQGWSLHTQPCNYMVSHDETRIVYEGLTYVGMNLVEAYNKSKLGAAALFMGTGTPMMYHGEEFGQNSPKSLSPQPLQWENLNTPEGSDLFDYYQKLIWLRNNWEVIRGGNLEIIHLDNSQKIMGMKRHDSGLGQTVYCVMNFNNFDQIISSLPFPYAGVWYEFIEDTQLNSESGTFSDYFIPSSSARIFTNYKNWDEGGEIEIDVDYLSGWNMVSLPINNSGSNYLEIYPQSVSGTLYGFDGTYYSTDNLVPGHGYWLFFDDAGVQTVSGNAIEAVTLSLMEGWNLMSGMSETIPVSSLLDPDGIIVSGTFYGFNGTYVNVEELEPGKGYWLNANSSGDITISSRFDGRKNAKTPPLYYSGNRLKLSLPEDKAISQDLYFGIELSEGERQRFSLPPKPPFTSDELNTQYLDVRYSDDSKLCGDVGDINILSHDPFIDVEYDVKGPEEWILKNANGTEYKLSGTGTIKIGGGDTRYRLFESIVRLIPNETVLHPAYPNPFNPVTLISYEIPRDGPVTLIVYDMLGKEIEKLVNEKKASGIHEINWNGFEESAGIYFIHLAAENIVKTQKLVLLK